jgi:hypothetical protein
MLPTLLRFTDRSSLAPVPSRALTKTDSIARCGRSIRPGGIWLAGIWRNPAVRSKGAIERFDESTLSVQIPLKSPAGVNVRPRSVQVTIEVRLNAVSGNSNGTRGSVAPNDGNTTNSGT